MSDYREHLRNKYRNVDPDTHEWEDPDGDYIVFVAPPEIRLEKWKEKLDDPDVSNAETNARLIIEVAHSPKTDADGELVRRDDELVPEDELFTEKEDLDWLSEMPAGNPLTEARNEVADWLRELANVDTDVTIDDYRREVERFVEMADDPEADDDTEIVGSFYQAAEKLLEEDKGNS